MFELGALFLIRTTSKKNVPNSNSKLKVSENFERMRKQLGSISELENFDVLVEQKIFLINQGIFISRFSFPPLKITEILNI